MIFLFLSGKICDHRSPFRKIHQLIWEREDGKQNVLNLALFFGSSHTQMLHVWPIYLHLADLYGFHVGKYTSPMDPLGIGWKKRLQKFHQGGQTPPVSQRPAPLGAFCAERSVSRFSFACIGVSTRRHPRLRKTPETWRGGMIGPPKIMQKETPNHLKRYDWMSRVIWKLNEKGVKSPKQDKTRIYTPWNQHSTWK